MARGHGRLLFADSAGTLREIAIEFELLLFTTDPDYAREAVAAGVDGVVIDWEGIGKRSRQAQADTEVNSDSPQDLSRIREAVGSRVICRINSLGAQTADEVEDAIARGADELLLPMAVGAGEVEQLLDLVAGRCGVGILVETEQAVESAAELAPLPLSRAFVGLNDLAIARDSASIFDAVADGTVERVRRSFTLPFGFGGLTLPDRGSPVPCRLLVAEMARLGCSFSFLRRSYRADVAAGQQASAIAAIRQALRAARERSGERAERDREELVSAIGRGGRL